MEPSTHPLLDAFLQYIAPPLITALASLVGFALLKLSQYLHAKGESSKLVDALAVGSDFAKTAFEHVRAKLEPSLKEKLADGVLTVEERAQLKAEFMTLLKAELPAGAGSVLQATLGAGFETWLSGKAEGAIAAAGPK